MAKEATKEFAGRPDSAILNRMVWVATKIHLILAAAFSILLMPVAVGIFLLSDRGYPVGILFVFVGWTVLVGATFFRFYRTDNPQTGIAISADQAPNLHAIVRDIAAQFDSVTVDRVVLTTDFGTLRHTPAPRGTIHSDNSTNSVWACSRFSLKISKGYNPRLLMSVTISNTLHGPRRYGFAQHSRGVGRPIRSHSTTGARDTSETAYGTLGPAPSHR